MCGFANIRESFKTLINQIRPTHCCQKLGGSSAHVLTNPHLIIPWFLVSLLCAHWNSTGNMMSNGESNECHALNRLSFAATSISARFSLGCSAAFLHWWNLLITPCSTSFKLYNVCVNLLLYSRISSKLLKLCDRWVFKKNGHVFHTRFVFFFPIWSREFFQIQKMWARYFRCQSKADKNIAFSI